MCLAQGHNAVTLVKLEPAAPQSRVKHSTTEPLRPLSAIGKSTDAPQVASRNRLTYRTEQNTQIFSSPLVVRQRIKTPQARHKHVKVGSKPELD